MGMVLLKGDKAAREKPCLCCGYSLRKLGDAKYCPECGLGVWISLNGNDALDWSHPLWIGRIAWACSSLAAAHLLGLAAYILVQTHLADPDRREAWLAILMGGFLIANSIGLVLLGSKEGRFPDQWKSYRIAAYILGVIGIILSIILVVCNLGGWAGRPVGSNSFWDILTVFIAIIVGLITWSHLGKISARIPSTFSARACKLFIFAQLVWVLGTLQWIGCISETEVTWIITKLPWIYFPIASAFLGWFSYLLFCTAVKARMQWQSETADFNRRQQSS
jgi:hypothetical protein